MKDRASKWNNFQLMFFKSQQLLVWVHVTEFSASARSCQTFFFFFFVSEVMAIYFEGIDKICTYYVFINCKSLHITLKDY